MDIRAKTLVVLKKDTQLKAFRWTEVMGSEQLDDSHLKIRFHHHRECVQLFNLLVWWGASSPTSSPWTPRDSMLTQTGWVADRSYVMQFMFPDDIAPLRRLLELIQVYAPPAATESFSGICVKQRSANRAH